MPERRRRPRKEISSDGYLFFGPSRGVFHCAALNVSTGGAKLALDRFYALPGKFVLSFDQFTTAQSCRMIWARGNFVGVKFEPANLP